MADFADNLEKFEEQENVYHLEGRQGVTALCRIARVIGYKDSYNSMQLDRDACMGDMLNMLEDNPGLLQAMHQWIVDNGADEWNENLENYMLEQGYNQDEDDEE